MEASRGIAVREELDRLGVVKISNADDISVCDCIRLITERILYHKNSQLVSTIHHWARHDLLYSFCLAKQSVIKPTICH